MKKTALILLSETEYSHAGIRGVASVREVGGRTVLRLSLIHAPSEETIVGVSCGETAFYPYEVGLSVPVDAECNGMGVALFVRRDEGLIPLLYGCYGKGAPGAEEMSKDFEKNVTVVGDEIGGEKEKGLPPSQAQEPQMTKVFRESEEDENPPYKPLNGGYDDEAVAAENYFAFPGADRAGEEVGAEDLSSESDGEVAAAEIAEADREAEYDGEREMAGDLSENDDREEEKEGEIFADGDLDGVETSSFGSGYYERIRGELEKTFSSFPEETELTGMIPGSRWVRIPYDEDEHYVVGILYEKGAPRYLCYGVPGRYGKQPEELRQFCTFIPSSPFSLKGDGYWVLYQDADTGKCLKPE
ncbi:MAG: hypothetical protein SOT34_05550 [Candidatus Borkfalkiaceae bacterium]|nr:hypothetical protein [Christensenellaceae bacterium]